MWKKKRIAAFITIQTGTMCVFQSYVFLKKSNQVGLSHIAQVYVSQWV